MASRQKSITTTRYSLNNEPIKYYECIRIAPDFKQRNFKNVPVEAADLNPFCYRIVYSMLQHVQVKLKYQYIFVRIQDLIPNKYVSNGLWHLDSSLNPIHTYDNFLFVAGENTTEFMHNEVEIEEAESVVDFNRKIESGITLKQQIPASTIVRYTGSNVHRGPMVLKPERRLLIRLTNTDQKLTRMGDK